MRGMLTLIAGLSLMGNQETAPTHPYQLPLNGGRVVSVGEGISDLRNGGQASSIDEIVEAAEGVRYVLVGESHDQLAHHQAQAEIIQALADAGRFVVVGMEMFTRDNQINVAPWPGGIWTDEEFVTASSWETQWGFDYALYKPIFDVVKAQRMPLYALNVPRDWVRQIGREGVGYVDKDKATWIPDLAKNLDNADHKAVFTSLMGGHPMTGARGDNIYAAQVSWDVGMAKSAIDAMADKFSDKWVMVIIAGSGHVMYGEGINDRITRISGEKTMSVICINEAPEGKVSSSLGEFVWVTGD